MCPIDLKKDRFYRVESIGNFQISIGEMKRTNINGRSKYVCIYSVYYFWSLWNIKSGL